jgi:uncharacterized protein YkwD
MKKKLSNFILLVVIYSIFSSCSADSPEKNNDINSSPIITNFNYNESELETMKLINNYRNSIGLNSLEKINHVSFKSEEHNKYMIANNIVNHNDFVTRSENIIKTLRAVKVSENIAYNYRTSQAALNAWLNSPGHKENIVGNFTHFGISIQVDPVNKKKYYTNIFVKI